MKGEVGIMHKSPKYLVAIEWKGNPVQRTWTTSVKPTVEHGMIHIAVWVNDGTQQDAYGFNLSELSMYSITPIIEEMP